MKHVIAIALALMAAPVFGQPAFLIVDKSFVPPSVTVLPEGRTTTDQTIIPRYISGTTHPSKSLIGWGPQSVIAATALTASQANPAVIITADNTDPDVEENISEWQAGSDGATLPAVLQPTLANCTVTGYISGYDWTQEGDVNDVPRVHNAVGESQGGVSLYKGADLYGNGGQVYNVGFFGIPGTACRIARRGAPRNGFQQPHDRLRWRVDHCYVRRCWRGIDMTTAVDSYMNHIEVEAVAEWGVKMGSSCQFGVIHVYGCGFPEAEGDGACLWMTGQQNMGGPVYLENATIGLHDAGSHNTINGITSHSCDDFNVVLKGQACKINGIDLRSCEVNLQFEGDQNYVTNGKITLQPSGVGIRYVDGTTVNGASSINNVNNVVLSGYRGDVDGDMTVETDEGFATGGTAIDVDATLQLVNITGITIGQVTNGIDFSDGGIANDGSVIWIQTTADVVNDVIWPDGETWDTTPDAGETCDIRINGVRYYGPVPRP